MKLDWTWPQPGNMEDDRRVNIELIQNIRVPSVNTKMRLCWMLSGTISTDQCFILTWRGNPRHKSSENEHRLGFVWVLECVHLIEAVRSVNVSLSTHTYTYTHTHTQTHTHRHRHRHTHTHTHHSSRVTHLTLYFKYKRAPVMDRMRSTSFWIGLNVSTIWAHVRD